MTHGPGRHPNRFRVECGADGFRRVIMPGNVLICLSCDRAYNNDGQLVGPGNAATARDVPVALGPIWDVRTRGN